MIMIATEQMDPKELMVKVHEFAAMVEVQQIEQLIASDLGCEANRINAKTSVKPGKKYIKVDIGSSGRYMIDVFGNIWGIKAYGVINRGNFCGTVNTINELQWGNYYGGKRAVVGPRRDAPMPMFSETGNA